MRVLRLPALDRLKVVSRWALTVLLTVVLLFLVLRTVQLGELAELLSRVSVASLVPAVVAALAYALARMLRFRLLLARKDRSSTGLLTEITMATWGVSLLLPGPSGDGVFVWLARRLLGTSIARGTGAVLMSRLLDIVSLLTLAVVLGPVAGTHNLPLFGELPALWLLAAMALILLLFLRRPRRALLDITERFAFGRRFSGRVDQGLEALTSRPVLTGLVIFTVVARVSTALLYAQLFGALGLPLSFLQVWFVVAVRTLFLAFPVQGIAGLGTSQVWWTGALTLVGLPLEDAVAASIAIHLLDLAVSLPIGILGWAFLAPRMFALRASGSGRSAVPVESAPSAAYERD